MTATYQKNLMLMVWNFVLHKGRNILIGWVTISLVAGLCYDYRFVYKYSSVGHLLVLGWWDFVRELLEQITDIVMAEWSMKETTGQIYNLGQFTSCCPTPTFPSRCAVLLLSSLQCGRLSSCYHVLPLPAHRSRPPHISSTDTWPALIIVQP